MKHNFQIGDATGRKEPQETDDPFCEHPRHDELCDCGATPDMDYESRLDI